MTPQEKAYKIYVSGDEHVTPAQVEDALEYSLQRQTYNAQRISCLAQSVQAGEITMKELVKELIGISEEMYYKNLIGE